MRPHLFFLLMVILLCCDDKNVVPLERNIDSRPNTPGNSSGRINTNYTFQFCNDQGVIGGGDGYSNIISGSTKTLKRTDKSSLELGADLKILIESAVDGDTIFIPFSSPDSDNVIDVSEPIFVNKRLVIASNRGYWNGTTYSLGALIRSKLTGSNYIFRINASGVRITGLRLEGDHALDSSGDGAVGVDRPETKIQTLEVDNCVLFGWLTAITISDPKANSLDFADQNNYQIKIHHNYFYDNNTPGYGYGVNVGNAFVKIYSNRFRNNRHDVTGDGSPDSGYEVYCNTIEESNTGFANIDMHGGDGNKQTYAGRFMSIHHNDFQDINPQSNIFITGRPNTLCLISNNKFETGNLYTLDDGQNGAIQQRVCCGTAFSSAAYGNVIAINNIYRNTYLGWYVKDSWDRNSLHNFFRIPSSNDLLFANLNAIQGSNGLVSTTQTLDYSFGDFDGDKKTDILKADGQKYYYLPLATGYVTDWKVLAAPSTYYNLGTVSLIAGTDVYKIKNSLILTHLDGDDITDLVIGDGSSIRQLVGINWLYLTNTDRAIQNHHFGFFRKVGEALPNRLGDSYRILAGGQWQSAYDLSINTSTDGFTNTTFANIAFNNTKTGDFDGDGYTDIFHTNVPTTNQWRYSSGSIGSWVNLSSAPISPDLLSIGNLDSEIDGKSDVIGLSNSQWMIAKGGASSWYPADIMNFPRSVFGYGNLK